MLFLTGLVLCGMVALTGAWPASLAPLRHDPEATFLAKAVPLDADIIGSGIDARQLLEKALGKLNAEEAVWLNTKIRQTVYEADSRFVVEGFLQRGPNQCARMEMEVGRSRLVIVSDGDILAHVQKVPGGKVIAAVERLPALTEETHVQDRTAREAFLVAKCCGGPAALLRPIQQHMRNGTLQTGLLQDRPVIQLKADLDPAKISAFSAMKLTALSACLYLDAKTLWPVRIDWTGAEGAKAPRLVRQIEFREPVVGVALDDDACARMFSYHPDGSENVTEVKRR